jgi:DNA helicase-2/ATP-dependent DNA helicase PcrA
MTRAMNTLILTRAHCRRRYGNDAPEVSKPSRFLEEVPSQLVENLSGRPQASSWATPGYPNSYGRRPGSSSDFADKHYNYEDESQETYAGGGGKGAPSKPFVASWMTPKTPSPSPAVSQKGEIVAEKPDPETQSIDNIARFFGGKPSLVKPGALPRPVMDVSVPAPATPFRKGQRVRHSKYGEGTILIREGDGEDAKLTVMFQRHGMKKLMEKFANLQKL